MTESIIEVQNLKKVFGDHVVLTDINFDVAQGEVVSIIGRFLEHHRIWRFHNAGGAPLFYFGSADWMSRNLKRRTEACVKIDDPKIQGAPCGRAQSDARELGRLSARRSDDDACAARRVALPKTIPAELQDILDGCLCDGKDSWEILPNGRSVHPAPREVLDRAVEDAMARRGGAAGEGMKSYLESVWLRARDIGCQGALMEKYDDHFDYYHQREA